MLSKKNEKIQHKLPVYNYEEEIINYIKSEKNNVTLLVGETGCGKTTQVPQILYKHFKSSICITQPRRVAAISVAIRVAHEMQIQIGDTVGYAVRFDEKYSNNTKIKYVTDGMLLRECIIDPKLSRYSIIILDEAHERSVNSDTLLALIKNLVLVTKQRPDLKLIVMSATLDVPKFSKYLQTENVLMIKGRSYPIEVYNVLEPQKSYIDSALVTILQIHMNNEEDYQGDILVFLPGQEDIEDLQELLNQKLSKLEKKFEVFVLFSALPNQEQMRVFYPLKDKRKIILATNIAETSITIKGIKFVVDCGFCKMRNYIHKSSIDTLSVTKISKNSAVQRAGRAGRESKGKCFRLYTEKEFNEMDAFNPPEILRINLRNLVLDLKAIGIENIHEFDFIDKPDKENFLKAYDELVVYGALKKSDYSLTDIGKKMSVLPVEPIYALILISSLDKEYTLVREEILTIISLLQTDNIFYTPSVIKEKVEKIREKFIHPSSDHLTLLNVFNQWKENRQNNKNFARDHFLNEKSLKKAEDVKKQLKSYLGRIMSKSEDNLEKEKELMLEEMLLKIESKGEESINNDSSKKEDLIVQCLLTGYFTNIAKYYSDNYFSTLKEKIICKVHPTSILVKNPKLGKTFEFLIYSEVIVTNKKYLKSCTLVRADQVRKYLLKE